MGLEKYIKELPELFKKVNCSDHITDIKEIKFEDNHLRIFYEFADGRVIERDVEVKIPFKPEIVVATYNDLPSASNYDEFTIAYVNRSQGTKWLIGNYYPNGYYINIGGWKYDNRDVYRGLQNILIALDTKRKLSPFVDTASTYILETGKLNEIHIWGSNFDHNTTFYTSNDSLTINNKSILSSTHAILIVTPPASHVVGSGVDKTYHSIYAKNGDATSSTPVTVVSSNKLKVLIPKTTSSEPLEVWKGVSTGITVGSGKFTGDGNVNWNKRAYFGRVDVGESCQFEFTYEGDETEGYGTFGFEATANRSGYRGIENGIYIRGITIRVLESGAEGNGIPYTYFPSHIYGRHKIVRLVNGSKVDVYYILDNKVYYTSAAPTSGKFVIQFYSQKNSILKNIKLTVIQN